MTEIDITKLLGDSADRMASEVRSLLAERDAADAAQRDAIDARIKNLEDKSAELDSQLEAQAKRVSLPGLTHDADHSGNGFSIMRAAQLAAAQANPHGPFRSALTDKSHGLEREVQAHFEERTYNVGTDSAGGIFVPQEVLMDSIIPQLEAQAVVRRAGATVLTGLRGDITFPVENGTSTAYYVDTEGEEPITESVETFESKKARPRTLAAMQKLSHKMMLQSSIGLESWINGRFAKIFALREDLSAIEGTGAAGQPLGLTLTTGVQATGDLDAIATAQAATSAVSSFVYALQAQNAYDPAGNYAWIMTPDVAEQYHGLSGAEGVPVFAQPQTALLERLAGYPLLTSTQFNGGSVFALFGDFSKLYLCNWGGMTIRATEEGDDAKRLRMSVIAYMDHDVVVAQPKAFNFTTSADVDLLS